MDRQGLSSLTEPHPFGATINLAHPRLGAEVVYATDDFFGDKARLISPTTPVFLPDKYDANGKWMDGWESRRRRSPGHDFAVLRLGMPALIAGLDIDTRHFTGNFPPEAAVDACRSEADVPGEEVTWTRLVERRPLQGNRQHFCTVESSGAWTHLRLHIFPDGGVARLRVWGIVDRKFREVADEDEIDLFAVENGGRALWCNDEHFGTMHNLNAPGRGINMGDGWETARRRTPGNDWVILALGHAGRIRRVVVDTAHFKGNYPERVALRAALLDTDDNATPEASETWPELLPAQLLQPDHVHQFLDEVASTGPVSHVRMNIYPDGGVSRLRLFGHLAR